MMIQPSSAAPSVSCSCIDDTTLHSSDAGEAATRGARTMRQGASARPAAANSLSPSACAPDDTFIASNNTRGTRLKTNSPVAIAFAAECFIVSLVNISIGGRECTALKKE